MIGGIAVKILFPILFPLSFALEPLKILGGTPANLDNGIRANQEEGAVR